MRCVVKNCNNTNRNKACAMRFYTFPSDAGLSKQWEKFCCRDGNMNVKTSTICMEHFRPEDFENSLEFKMGFTKRLFLKRGAVPTVRKVSSKDEERHRVRAERVEKREHKKIVEMLLKEHEDEEKISVLDTCEHKCVLCQKRCHPDNGYFFRVPQDESKRNLWSEICSVKFLSDSMICADHFSEKSFIRYKHRVTLMPDAVPIRPRLTKRQIEVNIGGGEKFIDDDNRSEILVNIPMTSSCPLLDDPLSLNKSPFVEPEAVRKQYMNKEVQTDPSMLGYEKYIYKCRQLETQIKELKLQLMRSSMAMNSLYKIFTEGQIRKLTSPADIHWREHDMENAWQLYKKGSGAYKYLYEKGFPLPHISSIQRWQRKHKKNENDNSTDVPSNENNEEALVEEEDEVNDFSGDDNDWFDDFYEEEAVINNDKISEGNNISTIKTETELIQDTPPQYKAVKAVADKNQDVRNKVKPETIATINVPSQYASPELNAIIASSNTKFFIAKKPTEVEIRKEQNPTIYIKDKSKSSTVKVIAAIRPRSQCDMPDLNNTTPAKKVKATIDADVIEQASSEKQNELIITETQIEPLDYNEFLKTLDSGDYLIDED